MKLALIQTKQNELYNFPGTRTFDTEEVLRLRHEYMEEVFRMTEEAAKEGADLIVTTEVVNYSGHFSKIKVPYADLYQEMGQAQEETSTEKNNKFDYDVTTNEETRFAAIASRYGVMILAGLARKENGKLYNSTVFWGRDGRIKTCIIRFIWQEMNLKFLHRGRRFTPLIQNLVMLEMLSAGICSFLRRQEILQRWALI